MIVVDVQMSGGADFGAYDVNEIPKIEMLQAAYDMKNTEVCSLANSLNNLAIPIT